MSSIVMCPSCKKNCAADAPMCPACGWSLQGDRDRAYNKAINFWGRVVALLAVLVCYCSMRAMGRPVAVSDLRDMLLYQLIPACVIYALLKMRAPNSGKNLWMTALVPSWILMAALFAWRGLGGNLPGMTPTVPQVAQATAAPTTRQAAAHKAAEAAARTQAAFDPLRPFARECFAFVARQPTAIVNEFESAGVARLVSPKEMEDPKRLEPSRARMNRLHGRLDDYEARIRKSAADVTAKVQASGATAEVKRDFAAAVRECGGTLMKQTLAFVALQRKVLDRSDELLALAQSRAGRYRVEGNRLRFADAADQKKHDALRRELDALAAQRDAMIRRLKDQGQQAMADLAMAPNQPAHASIEP